MRPKLIFLILASLTFAIIPAVSARGPMQQATMVLYNGKIFTADSAGTIVEAIAINGDRVVALGTTADIKNRYSASQMIDLKGRFVTPGFNDAHSHFANGGVDKLNVDLVGSKSLDEIRTRLAARIKNAKPGEWIVGRGWDHTLWGKEFPHREDLDSISPNNPVYITRVDGHVSLANTKALEVAGITKATKNPQGGEIERDAQGNATGMMKETAGGLVTRKIPSPTAEQREQGILMALEEAKQYGLTSLHDNSEWESFLVLEKLKREGKLTLRVYEWQNFLSPVDVLKKQRAEHPGDNMLRLGSLKGYMDGSLGSRTAYMLAPYNDDPHTSGIPRIKPEDLNRMTIERDKEGWQIAFHAIGDAGNRMALDAFEAAQKANGKRESRHRIEHAQVVHPDDFIRFHDLGVIASVQPCHILTDKRWAGQRIGPYRSLGAYAWYTFRSYVVSIPFGTDYPVETMDTYRNLYAAVTRLSENETTGLGWVPEEKLTMAEAIRYYTYDPAYASFEEKEKGTLEVGKLADIAVHSQDLLTISPQEVLKTRAVMVILGGKVIYTKE